MSINTALAWVPAVHGAIVGPRLPMAWRLFKVLRDRTVMQMLNNPAFWDKKFRIAILTLATFIALC
jgi:hypothetical protein